MSAFPGLAAEWLPPGEVARELGVTARALRNLESRGFPVRGGGPEKRHPWPAAAAWYHGWRQAIQDAGGHEGPPLLALDDAALVWTAHMDIALTFDFLRDPVGALEAWGLEEFPPDVRWALPHASRLLANGKTPRVYWPAGAPVPDGADW